MSFEQKIKEDLERYLVAQDMVDKHLPECPDVEDLWQSVAKAYIPDGIREFRDYPIVSLGWIMFVGMALAHYWDVDWEKYSDKSGADLYRELRDAQGFDNMDDYILEKILGVREEEAEKIVKIAGESASRTHHLLLTDGIEPGTKEAAQAYVSCLHQLYVMGMAMELKRLGYHMTAI